MNTPCFRLKKRCSALKAFGEGVKRMKKRLQGLAFCIAALLTPILIAFYSGDEGLGWFMVALIAITITIVVVLFLWRAIWLAKHYDASILVIVIFAVVGVIVICAGAFSLHII
jgi:hypothetical protein